MVRPFLGGLVACLALVAVPSASASITLSYTGTTINVTGTGGNETTFRIADGGDVQLLGGDGDDRLDGGAGLDSLFSDWSSCGIYACAAGNDTLLARDGQADAVNCGSGADSAQVDTIDTVAQDGFQACETVDRAAAPPPGAGTGGSGRRARRRSSPPRCGRRRSRAASGASRSRSRCSCVAPRRWRSRSRARAPGRPRAR